MALGSHSDQFGPWQQHGPQISVFSQVPHIHLFPTVIMSLVPPVSTVREPCQFAFSHIFSPSTPSFPSL